MILFTFSSNSQTINIMSYNIKSGLGMDNQQDFNRQANVIKQMKPDVVATQEIDSVTTRSNGKYVLGELATRTGLHPSYAPAINFAGGKYGIGILSKKIPLRIIRTSLPGREEQRALIIAEFDQYIFCCTHLSLTQTDRIASAEKIIKILTNLNANKPIFIAGDFNSEPYSPEIQEFEKYFSILNDVSTPTWPSNKPTKTIDYIMKLKDSPKTVKVKKALVLNEPVASDHRPVFIKVKIAIAH